MKHDDEQYKSILKQVSLDISLQVTCVLYLSFGANYTTAWSHGFFFKFWTLRIWCTLNKSHILNLKKVDQSPLPWFHNSSQSERCLVFLCILFHIFPACQYTTYRRICLLKYSFLPLQIAHLNSTVNDLQKRVELPGSASTITQDIESLKKGMADTGGDITEIKDKIKQLTKLASQENGKVEKLSKNVFNLSVSTSYVIYFKILQL